MELNIDALELRSVTHFMKRHGNEKGENIIDIKLAFFKAKFATLFILVNEFLSVTGFVAAMAAAKIDQYDNPFLIALPLSCVLRIIFTCFVKIPSEEEWNAIKKLHNEPPIKVSYQTGTILRFILEIISKIIIVIMIITVFLDFTMMLLITLKSVVAPLPCFH